MRLFGFASRVKDAICLTPNPEGVAETDGKITAAGLEIISEDKINPEIKIRDGKETGRKVTSLSQDISNFLVFYTNASERQDDGVKPLPLVKTDLRKWVTPRRAAIYLFKIDLPTRGHHRYL